MQNQLKQIQVLFQSKKFKECAEESQKLLDRDNRNLGAMILLAQALIQLDDLIEAQNVLNDLYSKIKRGGQEDAFFFNALTTQETLAIQLQSTSNSNQNKKKGREIQLTNKFQIIDFLDKKQKFEKMMQETEIYCLLLAEESRYKDIEDTHLWLMNHQGLSKEDRALWGLRIFEIDEYYNPVIKADQLLIQLQKLTPGSQKLSGLAKRILQTLDNNNSKKTLNAVLSTDTSQSQKDYLEFCQQLILAGDIVFESPYEIFSSPTNFRMFIRYTGATLLSLQFLSPEWLAKIDLLRKLYASEIFQSAQNKGHKQQIQLLLISLIDMTQLVQSAIVPDFKDLLMASAGSLKDIEELLTKTEIAGEASDVTPFVSAYLAVCALSKNPLLEIDHQTILAKIKKAQFIWTKMQRFASKDVQIAGDVDIYFECLRMMLKLDKVQVDDNFKLAEANFQKFKNIISPATLNQYNSLTSDLKWQSLLYDGDWLQAINALQQIVDYKPEKASFVAVKTCEIQLKHLSELCETSDQRNAQIKAIYNTLQINGESDSLLIQGYLLYTFSDILESDPKAALNKWLLALKKDQTNPDTFYSLAVYYFGIGDFKRAAGCLDKSLKLKGSFEPALVLAYHLTTEQESRLALVDKFMESNRGSAVSYFFRGLIMQQKQDFIQAIDMYQNAMKFYTISRQRAQVKSLIPQAKIQITENPFGIFGNHSASICWVYLSDCFFKIDKPSVALKCFNQAISEISKLIPEQLIDPSNDVKSLLTILNYSQFHPSELERTNDQTLKLLSSLNPQKWALECLLLGSKFVPSAQQSISVLHVALRCLPSENVPAGVLAFILTELIDKITGLIKVGVVIEDGAAKLYSESKEMISRLRQLVDFCVRRNDLDINLNLQKKILNALFIISQRTQDEQSSQVAIDRTDYLMTVFDENVFKRTFLLDTCKIIHEHRRFSTSEQLQEKKITLIRQAIRQDSLQSNLWVHLYLFSQDENVQAKAIFKAYDLEPESTLVQEHILRYYLKTKQWKKAFKILVRSYQQATNKNLAQQPIVLATLAYLNAVCYLEFGKKDQLSEAITLIKMIQREDMTTLLSELLFYLRHFSSDYIPTISYFKKNQSKDNNLLLLKAYFGASVTTLKIAQNKIDLIDRGHELLLQVFEADQQPYDVLINKCEHLVGQFLVQPQETASTLALYQEICLQKGIVLSKNILYKDEVKQTLQQLTHGMQRVLLVQSLRMIQQREGKIPEAGKILTKDGALEEVNAVATKTYTNFIVDMSRFKPQNLSAMQHRALFRHFINSQSDNSLLKGFFNNDKSQVKDQNLISGLSIVLSQRKDEEDNSQSLLMRNPLSIEANTKWLWSLLRAGKLEQAVRAHKLVKQKIQLGIMSGEEQQFAQVDNFISAVNGGQTQMQAHQNSLSLISQIAAQLRGATAAVSEDVKLIAAKTIQCIERLEVSEQPKIIYLLCKTLELTLQDQGHFTFYNKLIKELVNFAVIARISAQSTNVLWNFQLLSTASVLIETKKLTQISAVCKEGMQLCDRGQQKRSNFPISLIQARMHLQLGNHKQVVENLKVDEAVLERDFLIALSLYAQQSYKEFYLLCIGIVAGAKASQSQIWQLAYAYYLKAFAEMTFLSARKQGVTLKEDFDANEGVEFDTYYFTRKAKSSISKCKRVLISSGSLYSLIDQAIATMENQLI